MSGAHQTGAEVLQNQHGLQFTHRSDQKKKKKSTDRQFALGHLDLNEDVISHGWGETWGGRRRTTDPEVRDRMSCPGGQRSVEHFKCQNRPSEKKHTFWALVCGESIILKASFVSSHVGESILSRLHTCFCRRLGLPRLPQTCIFIESGLVSESGCAAILGKIYCR